MTSTTPESRGRIAYTAYGARVKYLAHNGEPMPMFDGLPDQIRQAWIDAAETIWSLATTGRATIDQDR